MADTLGTASVGAFVSGSFGTGMTLSSAAEVVVEAPTPTGGPGVALGSVVAEVVVEVPETISIRSLAIMTMEPADQTTISSSWPTFLIWTLASGDIEGRTFLVEVEFDSSPLFLTSVTMRKPPDFVNAEAPTVLKLCCSSASPPSGGCYVDTRLTCCVGAWSSVCTPAYGPKADGVYYWRARVSDDNGVSFSSYQPTRAFAIDSSQSFATSTGSITVTSGTPSPHLWFADPSEGAVAELTNIYGQSFESSGVCASASVQVLFPPAAANVDPALSAEASYACVPATADAYNGNRTIDPAGTVNVEHEVIEDEVPATASVPGGPLAVRGNVADSNSVFFRVKEAAEIYSAE